MVNRALHKQIIVPAMQRQNLKWEWRDLMGPGAAGVNDRLCVSVPLGTLEETLHVKGGSASAAVVR